MSTESSWIGREIRTYKILSLLGKGGMGEVYRARDTRLDRDVAIKVLPASFANDPSRRSGFEQEARALAALNHSNIGAIYGFEEVGDHYALVLELVEGPTLADRLRVRRMGIEQVLRVARQICDALEAAHEKGIVHRDLKPANIKITPEGGVKILDFGLAKVFADGDIDLSQAPTRTTEGAILGTPAYMSPEQARGQKLDKRSDIWAFGCVLYEMLTGRSLFARNTVSDTIAAVLGAEPAWNELPGDTPPNVLRLLRRCLERDPKRRLHDIADARIELDDSLAAADSSLDRPRSFSRRAYVGWIGVSAVTLSAVVAVAVIVGMQPDADTGPRLSRALRVTNSAAQEFGPAISPDGKWIAYYSNVRGPTDVWVKSLDTGATLNLTASLNLELEVRAGIGGLAISPDGTMIAFAARQQAQLAFDTWVIPAPIGGVPRKLLPTMRAMQWSLDGKQILAIRPGSSRGDALVIANSDGTNQRDLISPQGGRHIHWPAWSPDGHYIYFIYTYDTWHNEPSEIYRIAASGGMPEPAVRSVRRAVYPIPFAGGDLGYSGNPESIELGLWWQPAARGASRPLTTGVGELAEARLSADGRKIVATFFDMRQSLVLLPLDGGLAKMRPITDGYNGDLDPVFDPRGGRIAFSSSRLGHRNLWLSRPDGSEATVLTTETAIDARPAFSPDGQQIAFVSDRGGQRGIWVMNTEGGAPTLLGTTEILDTLTWSRDGKRILFAVPGGDMPHLSSISVADHKIDQFSTPAAAVAPTWSPKADVIAYLEPTTLPGQTQSTPGVSILRLALVDGNGQRLYPDLPNQQFPNGFLAWSPDGKRVAAVSAPAAAVSSVWIVEPGAREPYKKLADFPSTVQWLKGITWTPDGSAVIVGQQEAMSDIVLFDVTR